MMDAIHYLVGKIKSVWGKKRVTSVLFLDVEGAFPNAVTDRLIHNLKKVNSDQIHQVHRTAVTGMED